jgi:geranylgeranyl diphosphate synthase, type I
MSALAELQARFGAAVDDRAEQWLRTCSTSTVFSGMMRYQMGYVDEQHAPLKSGGGKRLRPLLCLLACEAAGGDLHTALDVAAAIELLHNFSLIHDDIEDRDPTRRHRPTVWKLWGDAQGINVGDGMFALASRACLALDDATTAVQVTREFQSTALALTEGQYLDMSFEGRADVREDEYLTMIACKTAGLVAFSTWAGGRVAGASATTIEALRVFGHAVGMAFQIRDDVRGIWASWDETGKVAGTDLENRKKTLPVLRGAARAEGEDRDLFAAYLDGGPCDLAALTAALDRMEIHDEMAAEGRDHLAHGLAALDRAAISDEGRETLRAVAEELTGQRPATDDDGG